ncbi:VWA domain-containing protein, partial [bacterium]|nr:VWA domain-containing protein [bacterium]
YYDGGYIWGGAGAIVLRKKHGPGKADDEIIVALRGTDSLLDVTNYLDFINNNYVNAFRPLLNAVKDLVKDGSQISFTGHSLGAGGVNQIANVSDSKFGGFFANSDYATFATPLTYAKAGIFNFGFENDIVFKAADVFSTAKSSITPHIYNWFDGWTFAESVNAHSSLYYADAVERIKESVFFDTMNRKSWIVVDNTPDTVKTGKIGAPGDAIIFTLGNPKTDDHIVGGKNNDFMEGSGGNDILEGGGNDDILDGGLGKDELNGGTVGDPLKAVRTITMPDTGGKKATVKLWTPFGSRDKDIWVKGTIEIEKSAPKYNIVYVVDRSGSMGSQFSGSESVGNPNGNSTSNELIDGAIVGFTALNRSLVKQGAGNSNVAVVQFDDSTSTIFTGTADQDSNTNSVPDAVEALRTLTAGGNTYFDLGLQQAINYLNGFSSGKNVVVFLSDGAHNGGDYSDEVQTLLNKNGIDATIRAVGLGSGASMSDLDLVDDGKANNSATRVLTPSQLTATLLGDSNARNRIKKVELLVNNKVVAKIDPDDLVYNGTGFDFNLKIKGLKYSSSDFVKVKVTLKDKAGTTFSALTEVRDKSDDDVLRGGKNDDLYKFSKGAGGDVIKEISGTDTIQLLDGITEYRLFNGNNLNDLVLLSDGLDEITIRNFFKGGGNRVENLVLGNGTTVSLTGGLTLTGDQSSNTLKGTKGDDVLLAGGGADLLIGGSGLGNDIYDGGPGKDTIQYSSAKNPIYVYLYNNSANGTDIGNDKLFNIENVIGGRGNDQLYGDSKANKIEAGKGDDYIYGEYSSTEKGSGDVLKGEEGNDRIYGYAGKDRIDGGPGNDYLNGGEQADVIRGGTGNDTLYGDDYSSAGFADRLFGDEGDDYLYGYAGGDVLDGGPGSDRIYGGNGADELIGGRGDDYLYGEGGKDAFIFDDNWGHDTISGFDPKGEKLDLSQVKGLSKFSQLTITEDYYGTTVKFDGNSILLSYVSKSEVTSSDFIL